MARVMSVYLVHCRGRWKKVRATAPYTAMWKAFPAARGYHWAPVKDPHRPRRATSAVLALSDRLTGKDTCFGDVFNDRDRLVERFEQDEHG